MAVGLWLECLMSAVWSGACPGCGQGGAGGRLCDGCARALAGPAAAGCGICGEGLVAGAAGIGPGDRCAACLDGRAFDLARALGSFRGLLRDLVLEVKYRRRVPLGHDLGRRAALRHRQELAQAEWVVPMPLGRRRLRQRGHNQALAVAAGAAAALGLGLRPGWLRRVRDTLPQTTLTRAGRRENVRGAFAARTRVRGRRILLVDDVLTTGATAEEAARALRRAGALSVQVLTIARAERDPDERLDPAPEAGLRRAGGRPARASTVLESRFDAGPPSR